ncbi:hypothetical protein chiPu_0025869, partial [Chiloscyllium punctatum]|nr:hypothetical protein [Chiloscyllium punctatum]
IEGLDPDNARLVARLAVGGQVVTVSQFSVRFVDPAEYKRYSKDLTNVQWRAEAVVGPTHALFGVVCSRPGQLLGLRAGQEAVPRARREGREPAEVKRKPCGQPQTCLLSRR